MKVRYKKIIRNTHDKTRRFDRISSGNKFQIISNKGMNQYTESDNDLGITYLDSVIEHLEQNNVKQVEITKLVKLL